MAKVGMPSDFNSLLTPVVTALAIARMVSIFITSEEEPASTQSYESCQEGNPHKHIRLSSTQPPRVLSGVDKGSEQAIITEPLRISARKGPLAPSRSSMASVSAGCDVIARVDNTQQRIGIVRDISMADRGSETCGSQMATTRELKRLGVRQSLTVAPSSS